MRGALVSSILIVVGFAAVPTLYAAEKSGETLFNEYCSACHAKGENIINSQKTLYRIDREANGVRKPQDIVKKMRNPGPGMSRYGKNMISDGDALKIGEYIIKTFR